MPPRSWTEQNPIRRGFQAAAYAIEAVIEGRKPAQMILSPEGRGKTFMVDQQLRKHGIKAPHLSPKTDGAFVEGLYKYRDHHEYPVLVMDDCDVLAHSEVVANRFKTAFAPPHLVVYQTRKTLGSKDSIPPEFPFHGRLIWLSNINYTDPRNIDPEMRPHWKAMESRGLDPIWIDSPDDEDLFAYIVWLVVERNMLRNEEGLKRDINEAALNWFIEHRNHVKELSPRCLVQVAQTFKNYPGEDKRKVMLSLKLTEEPIRKIPGIPPMKIVGHQWQNSPFVESSQPELPFSP